MNEKKSVYFIVIFIFFLLFIGYFLEVKSDVKNVIKTQEKTAHETMIFPTFKTKDLEENMATNTLFLGHITALYIWTTNCQSCIEHIQEIAEIARNFTNVQVIGLVADTNLYGKNITRAKELSFGIQKPFRQLIVTPDFEEILTQIKTVPTTLFISPEGRLIGQPAIGNDVDFIRKEILYLLGENAAPRRDARALQDRLLHDH